MPPAGPSRLELARRLTSIRDDPVGYLEDVTARYGDLVAFPVPRTHVLLVSDPEAARRVLQSRASRWTKDTVQFSALAAVTGPGLLAAADDGWLDRRRAAQPAFHHGRLPLVADTCRAAASAVTASWDSRLDRTGAPDLEVDVPDLAGRVTLDVVGRTLFGTDLDAHTEELVRATETTAELVVADGSGVPWPRFVATPLRRRRDAAVRALDRVCARLIADRRARGVTAADDDLLGLLVGAGWSDRAIRNELVTMVVAGHETVASALGWTLLLLAEHPAVQDRVAGDAGWARAAVEESLRLYPPGWVLTRRAAEPDELAGRPVPRGTVVILSPWLLHRRPDRWPDPLAFRPERFLPGSYGDASARGRRTSYLPFGWGPRQCVGRDFALAELVALLTELLRDHRVGLPEPFVRPRLDAWVTLRPRGGLRLRVSRRPPAPS